MLIDEQAREEGERRCDHYVQSTKREQTISLEQVDAFHGTLLSNENIAALNLICVSAPFIYSEAAVISSRTPRASANKIIVCTVAVEF